MFFCEPTTNCEHKTQKILRTGGKLPSMFCECIWGGGAAPSPSTPLQLFFLKAYLLCRDSSPPIETSPWKKKYNSQNKKKISPKIFPHPFLSPWNFGDSYWKPIIFRVLLLLVSGSCGTPFWWSWGTPKSFHGHESWLIFHGGYQGREPATRWECQP